MDNPSVPPQKKGLGALAWLGIGCGALIVIIILGVVGASVIFGPKLKQFAEDAQKNPTRTVATTMVSVSMGQFEMVKEDDINKRYTVKEKSTGKLTTIYWDAKTKAPVTIQGDFSGIPADANPPSQQPEGQLTPK
ncbi:MAG: hypothetical protein ABJF10_13065 [Chthoniobacter sp.]|uniref:hypothetical protein n=1 Tax=Chthoniobacter sp. TaxID=2510640 RepID=UPI0032A267A6